MLTQLHSEIQEKAKDLNGNELLKQAPGIFKAILVILENNYGVKWG